MTIRALGYIRLHTAKLDEWRAFGTEVLGTTAVDLPGGGLGLRIDDYPARVALFPGESERMLASGWEVRDHRALAGLTSDLEAAGYAVERGTAEEAAQRRVEDLVRVDDPGGNRLEFYHGPALDHTPPAPPYGNRFVTGRPGIGDLGFGHIVLPAPDIAKSHDFYTDVLGFRLRDSMRLPASLVGGPPEETVTMRFLGCNPRHHSIGLFPAPMPTGIAHFMLELETLDDVGRGLDRFLDREIPIRSTLGRHTNDRMVSFYADTPSGFQVEYGCDAILVDDDVWTAKEITADAFWGHRWSE